jgi:hypothetical protein
LDGQQLGECAHGRFGVSYSRWDEIRLVNRNIPSDRSSGPVADLSALRLDPRGSNLVDLTQALEFVAPKDLQLEESPGDPQKGEREQQQRPTSLGSVLETRT